MCAATPVRDRAAMIARMAPHLDGGVWHFFTTTDAALIDRAAPKALSSFAEDEGISFILPDGIARDLGFDTGMPMARITLKVNSALVGVCLTAAVAGVLAEHGIP